MSLEALSPRVSLERSRKQAKDLVQAFRSGDPDALDRIRWNHPRFAGLGDAEIRARAFKLADAQLVIARLHYFESWPKLRRYIDTLERGDARVLRFEAAADAIVAGDLAVLGGLLHEHPRIVDERSTRAHRAPLLHYVTANGLEHYRQRTPANVLSAARLLLDAGAEVDARSEAYGGGYTALGLVATSTPPRRAGAQIPLIDVLLERGASVGNAAPGAGVVLAALANDCPEAAAALVARGANVPNVVAAAGVGRLDLVVRLAADATERQLEEALIMAARYGSRSVVAHLVDRGVDVAASNGMTALHHAAGRADLDMLDLLIRHGAPLEVRNAYGGTVLDNVLWFAHHVGPELLARRDYPAVIDRLIAAGARTDVYPEMQGHVDEVRRRPSR